jgi:hypothetical protein
MDFPVDSDKYPAQKTLAWNEAPMHIPPVQHPFQATSRQEAKAVAVLCRYGFFKWRYVMIEITAVEDRCQDC